jgi:hypothetical protein
VLHAYNGEKMKNQYYGDINDFKKYSLIRHLTGEGEIQITMCWALTENDEHKDGSRVNYLMEPPKWRKFDPIVFDQLRRDLLIKGERKVENIELSNILANCRFFNQILKDDEKERDKFFQEFYEFSQDTDLIFLDPDNGLEIKSIPRGAGKSSKYVYWKELLQLYNTGKSLLVYQHFPRRNREHFIDNITSKVFQIVGSSIVFLYITSNVLFILIPQKKHERYFRKKNLTISKNWKDLIIVKERSVYIYFKQFPVNTIITPHVEQFGT